MHLYTIDGKLNKKFHDFKEIFEEFLKKFWEMAENLSERGFIGEVVKAEILHFVQDDAPGRERLLRQRFFATLRVTGRESSSSER